MPPEVLSIVPERLQDLPEVLARVEGFPAVVSALRHGRGAVVDGAWGSSAALATAVLARSASEGQRPRTLLVVLAHPRDLDGWSGDLSSFAGVDPVVFPAWDDFRAEAETSRGAIDEVAGQRLRILKHLESSHPPRLLLTTLQALIQPVPGRAQLAASRRKLQTAKTVDLEEFAGWLIDRGYRHTEAVELPGEFSRRGGILDVFSPDAEAPYRLELFGDDIESIRQFSPQTQRSLGQIDEADIVGLPARSASKGDRGHLCDYLPDDSWTVLVEVEDLREQGKHYLERVAEETGLFSVEGVFQQLLRLPSVTVSALPSPSVEATCHLHVESVERLSGEVGRVRDELDAVAAQDVVLIACHNEGECKRLSEVLAAGQLAQSDRLRLVTGRVRAGFRLIEGSGRNGSAQSLIVLGGQELFHREEVRQVQPRRRLESRAIDSFLDLAEGDLVVHVGHGIARYCGMQVIEKGERGRVSAPSAEALGALTRPRSPARQSEEHLILEFAGGVRVYVPASKIDLVQKYVGGSKTEPELSKFGGTSWQKRKARVEEAVMDLASDMIQLQALREAEPGTAFPPDTEWQSEFEASFPYQETPDQLTSIAEIKTDMQRPRPMDRLLCGDVGYGKTELAIRAAFKTIDNGRQVAVLVPTTVLAEQHYRTFSQRLAEYPFTVECLSRFRSAGEQRRIVERLKKGGIDIIIGTHRLVSADVQFKDLGLVIIDEEQRFGVEHKERLKHLRQKVDVLTMTATPIPRTLHLSLLGIRDISNLETPPPDRLAIETRIARFDKQLIRHAVLRELNRDGQVYFVHNRVQNIHEIASRLEQIVPEARIAVVHGQMAAEELEHEMLRFVRREADILVATTIIESGLDIPNANTIFINQADIYGLADLHQLRGRVGRYKHRAYAYLLLDSDRTVTPNAARRLKAIEEFTDLGAGFKIALRDLEIRGAGNILGTQQSGHIAAVGYELYCQLLENAVRTLKQQPLRTPLEVRVDLPWSAYLPRDYVQGQRLRIEVYRRLARVRRLERLEDFRQEMRDRFGAVPEPAEWLLRLAELRLLAAQWKIASIHLEKSAEVGSSATDVVFGYRNPRRMQTLAARSNGRLRIVDDASAYCRLTAAELESVRLYAVLKSLLGNNSD
ncbi:MAG TPA: transcription-repair coupling factor [Gemmataceae bacterium]|nr:transcription-repair coupling factor [Gemmataceae bacterium]